MCLAPKAMVEALTASRIRYRYHVVPDANSLMPFFKYFSEAVQDATLSWEGPIYAKAMDRTAGKHAVAKYYRAKVFQKIALIVLLFWALRKIRKM